MAIPAIKIEGLFKSFGALRVLDDLSLSVAAGEYVAIIGPNGAGKSTLLNVIGGELPATAGAVYIFGQKITAMPIYRRAHLGLARSFQTTRLFRNLTVLDNISLAFQGRKSSRYQMLRPFSGYSDVRAKAQELLESIDLWQKKNEPMKALSYGEQRRLEFAVSLASEPKVLLLDEPSAGLAIGEVPDFINTIKNLAGGTTLIFCAHDMDVVFGLARRVVVLYSGKFVADGTCEEIQHSPLVKEIYLGTQDGTSNIGTE